MSSVHIKPKYTYMYVQVNFDEEKPLKSKTLLVLNIQIRENQALYNYYSHFINGDYKWKKCTFKPETSTTKLAFLHSCPLLCAKKLVSHSSCQPCSIPDEPSLVAMLSKQKVWWRGHSYLDCANSTLQRLNKLEGLCFLPAALHLFFQHLFVVSFLFSLNLKW